MSHGCVRLSVKNAATLWELVKQEKMANTKVVLSGAIPDAGSPAVARSRPMPLNTDNSNYRAPMPLAVGGTPLWCAVAAVPAALRRRSAAAALPILFRALGVI